MKIMIILMLCVILITCEEKITEPETLVVINRVDLHAYDYATNFFFLDTAYKSIYSEYFKSSTPQIPNSEKAKFNRIKQIEVWMAKNSAQSGEDAYLGVAFADLNPVSMKIGEYYDSDIKNSEIEIGRVERALFVKIDSNEYSIDKNLGIIRINNLRPDRYYAVAYRIEGKTQAIDDDIIFGTLSNHIQESDTLVLKLIYRQNMQPGFISLWDRQMKNKYYIGETNTDISKSEIKIYYINDNNDTTEYLIEYDNKLVEILNVDNINNSTGAEIPDGEFDLRKPYYEADNGIVTFPSLEPFREGLIKWAQENNYMDSINNFVFHGVYDSTSNVAKLSDKDRFLIIYNKFR